MTDRLLINAIKEYMALSVDERINHDRAQRRSWVKGNLKLSNPQLSDEEIDKIVEAVL
jgi:hypothetical protein